MLLEDRRHRKARILKSIIPWYECVFVAEVAHAGRMADFAEQRKEVYDEMDDLVSLYLKEVRVLFMRCLVTLPVR
jgi:hypothetical protein